MSSYKMTTDRVIHRAYADTDYTILILDGEAVALVEDDEDGDECIGYYQTIGEGQYVYNQYEGYSYYVQDDALHRVHGEPDDMTELNVNDGDQSIACSDGDIAELLE